MGTAAIDTAVTNRNVSLNRIVLILPGVTGCSNDIYIKDICGYLLQQQFIPKVVNYRGLRKVSLSSEKLYCFASVDDVEEAFDLVFNENPSSTFFAIGISLGASLLCNYVARCKNSCRLKGAVCISAPYDLVLIDFISSKILQNLLGWLCKKVLVDQVSDRNGKLYKNAKLERIIPLIKTTKDYNKLYIVPEFKFKTLNDYLRKASWYINK